MIFSMIRKELKIMLKDKGLFFWTIGLPILFIVIFASVFGNVGNEVIKVHYLDQDQSGASEEFLTHFADIEGFELITNENLSLEEQIEKINNGKLSSLIVIPVGFAEQLQSNSETATIEFYLDGTAQMVVTPILAVLENIANGYREGQIATSLIAAGVDGKDISQILSPPIKINQNAQNVVKLDMVTQVVPGYTVMFVFFIIITMVNRFIKDKDSGMTARLRSTSLRPIQYLIGMWVPNVLIVLVQCIALLSFGYFVYGLHLGHIGSISILILTLAICSTSFGLAIAMIVQTENQGVAITQIFALGGAALGGLWVPFEFLPKILQMIGQFTPQYWAQVGLQDVMLRGATISGIWPSIAVLLLFSGIGLLIASLRYNNFLKTATN